MPRKSDVVTKKQIKKALINVSLKEENIVFSNYPLDK